MWFFRIWVEILGVSCLFLVPFLKKERKDYSLFLALFLFALSVFLTSLWGVNFSKSFWGNPYREDGLNTFFHLCALAFATALIWQDSWLRPFIKSLTLANFILSLWVIISAFRFYVLKDINVVTWDGAIGISFGNPNFLAGYLATTLPLSFSPFLNIKPLRKRAIQLSQVAAILLTHSWSGVLTVIVLFIMLTIAPQGKAIKNKLIPIASLSLLFLLTIGLYIFNYQKTANSYSGYMPEGRMRIITKALLAIKQKPFFGWGLTNFDVAFDNIDWPMKWGHDIYVDKTHSLFLEVLVTSGVLGFGFYLLLIYKTFTNLLKQSREYKYLLLVFILFLIHSQTNVISISEEVFFWIMVGVAATLRDSTPRPL